MFLLDTCTRIRQKVSMIYFLELEVELHGA